MSLVVFSGPTLSPDAGRALLPDAEFPGPAGRGDVHDAVRGGASGVVLIDGYFEHRLSPWHKELLWALHEGVPVHGAASLGALRAVELAAFGMLGHGRVYECFAAGELEDDDEVAVVHEPAERGYAPLSEALVNVRFTLRSALDDGAVSRDAARGMLEAAQSLFYPERVWGEILARASALGVSGEERQRMNAWLARRDGGRVNQKERDARELLLSLKRAPPSGRAAPRVDFSFSYTELWHEFVRERSRVEVAPDGAGEDSNVREGRELAAALLERDPVLSQSVLAEAALRALSLRIASALQDPPTPEQTQAFSEAFRRQRGLYTPEQTLEWLEREGLTLEGFSRLVFREARAAAAHGAAYDQALANVAEVLRRRGMFRAVCDGDCKRL